MTPTFVQYRSPSVSFLLEKGAHIPVDVQDRPTIALLDTGASYSYIDLDFARSLRLPEIGVHTASGATSTATYPTFDANFYIPLLDLTLDPPIRALPLKLQEHFWKVIVGRDVLRHYELTINWRTGDIRFVSA